MSSDRPSAEARTEGLPGVCAPKIWRVQRDKTSCDVNVVHFLKAEILIAGYKGALRAPLYALQRKALCETPPGDHPSCRWCWVTSIEPACQACLVEASKLKAVVELKP